METSGSRAADKSHATQDKATNPIDYDEWALRNAANTLRIANKFDINPDGMEEMDLLASRWMKAAKSQSDSLLESNPEIQDIVGLSGKAIDDYFPEFKVLAPIKNVTFFQSGEVGKDVSPLTGAAAMTPGMLIVQANMDYFSSEHDKLTTSMMDLGVPENIAGFVADARLAKILTHEYIHLGSAKMNLETDTKSVVVYCGVEVMKDGPHGPNQGINELLTDYLALKCMSRYLDKNGLGLITPFLVRSTEFEIAKFFDALVGEAAIKTALINHDIDVIARLINNPRPDSGFEDDPNRFDTLIEIAQELTRCQNSADAKVFDAKLEEFMQAQKAA